MKALILAGGFAKRLWPLTLDKAKPLLPVGGKPVVSHIVEKIPAGVPIIVSTNTAFAEDFSVWRQTHADRDITIYVEPTQSEQNKKGALAAIALAIREFSIDEDLLMIGGDNFFTGSVVSFLDSLKGQPTLGAYDIQDLEGAKKYGVVVADGSIVKSFQEKPEQPLSTLVGTCCYFFPQKYIPVVLEAADLMPDKLGGVFEHFLKHGIESHVYRLPGYWNDIGSFDAYLDAHVQSGTDLSIPKHLLEISHGNTFEGVNHIDPSAKIVGSRVRNSIVLANAVIEKSTVDTCIVDRDAVVSGETRTGEILRTKD